MDLAAFSPRKLQLLNQSSPRASARKRSLFPTNSPQSNDLGLISELCSDGSDVNSPPPSSPSSSITPNKDTSSHITCRSDQVLKATNRLQFSNYSPQETLNSLTKSPRTMSFGKENTDYNNMTKVRKSPKKPSRNVFLDKKNFDDHFITVLSNSSEKQKMPVQFEMKRSNDLITPKNSTTNTVKDNSTWQDLSVSKHEVTIKPNNFYGKVAPILATNQTNRIQGMKCVFRPLQQSRAKTKLLFEEKPRPGKKRERSRSMDITREAKRRKAVFTGVHHAVPKPTVKHSPPTAVKPKQGGIREKAYKVTDLSRTPYSIKKKIQQGWEHTVRFTRPLRYEESPNMGEKRKFFKTSVQDLPSSDDEKQFPSTSLSPFIQKKRKLLDTRKCYLEDNSPEKPKFNGLDILELIEDGSEKTQDKPEVDDILLRLEEDDEEEKKREAEKQILMNILEDSPTEAFAIDSLSNCTASLDLNDSFSGSGCSRFSLDDVTDSKTSPNRVFSIFNTPPSKAVINATNKGTSSRKKWFGTGEDQLQIDAGQKRFGACKCSVCGMVYQVGEAEDEIQHKAFHNNLTTLRYTGWKNENVVGCFGLDYALVITGDDPKSWQQKALEVLALIDKSLGITSEVINVMHNHKVFLYISEKRIVGCMVATPVARAYKMMNSESDVDFCSEESFPVRCGISRMWTLFSHRRRGVASKLLDTVRRNFMYGYILSKDDIAFSIPTCDGKRFATKYMGYSEFNIYTGC